MTPVTRQQQHATLRTVLHKGATGAEQCGVQLVSRSILGVAVEDIPGDQSCLADTVEKLVSGLARGLVVLRPIRDNDSDDGGGEATSNDDGGDSRNIFLLHVIQLRE